MPDSNPPRRAAPGRRPRASILLLLLVLINTLGVSVLGWYALRAQLLEAQESRRHAERLALDVLGTRIEYALYQTILDPMLMLRTLHRQGAGVEELQEVLDAHEFVRTLLVLDRDHRQLKSWPGLDARERDYVLSEVLALIDSQQREDSPDTFEVQSFVDTGRSPARLYTFQAIGARSTLQSAAAHVAVEPEWVLIGSDIERINASIVQPRLERFAAAQGSEVALREPGMPASVGVLSFALTHVLPGWQLEMQLTEAPGLTLLGQAEWPTIATSVGLLLAIALLGVVILWELRREQELLELRNRFVANVSHELKTPLSLIRMYAETLYLRRLNDEERRHEYHRIILSEAERLSRMIGDVLDFSRLRKGLPVYHLTQSDLRGTVEQVIKAYADEWRERGASVHAEIQTEIAPVLHDPQGVTQMVLNLVDNAIKYGGDGSEIRLGLCSREDVTQLSVTDRGQGIANDTLRRILYAVESGIMVEEASGSGLGLVLVRKICAEHGAQFALAPGEAGIGMVATISFPNHEPPL